MKRAPELIMMLHAAQFHRAKQSINASNSLTLVFLELNEAMTLSKEKIDLRHRITPVTNSSIQFGSVGSVTMLEMFIQTCVAQTGTSGDTTL